MFAADVPLWLAVVSTTVVPLVVVAIGAWATVRFSQSRWKQERVDLENRWTADRLDLERRWAAERKDVEWQWRRGQLRDVIGVCVSRFVRCRDAILTAHTMFEMDAETKIFSTHAEIKQLVDTMNQTEPERNAVPILLVLADDPLNTSRADTERQISHAQSAMNMALIASVGSPSQDDAIAATEVLDKVLHALLPLETKFLRLAALTLEGLPGHEQVVRLNHEITMAKPDE